MQAPSSSFDQSSFQSPLQASALEPWLALYHLPEIGLPRLSSLLAAFDNKPLKLLKAAPAQLKNAGVGESALEAIQQFQVSGKHVPLVRQRVDADLDWLARSPDHRILSLDSPAYPPLLRQIPDPPPLLYLAGQTACLQQPVLAMVGSRKPSAGGRRLARRFAGQLAEAGFTISSGLAYGIDRESHVGALQVGGLTVAVLGSGLERIYPERHHSLADEIRQTGLLMSEFPLQAEPLNWHFPRRNRIVTGLSLGVLVVEAALRSGSLVSASCAMDQGREVFAVPGNIDNPQVRGCHHLLKQGARLVEVLDDVLEELGTYGSPRPAPGRGSDPSGHALPDLNREEQKVLSALGYDSLGLEQLQQETGLQIDALTAALTGLELAGVVQREAGLFVCLKPQTR